MKRAICHEAGHAITALHLGFHVEKIAVCNKMPNTQIDLDSPQRSQHDRLVVLAGGIAAERLFYEGYDQEAARDDLRKISERGGHGIEAYIQAAADIITAKKAPFQELRRQLTRRLIEEWAGAKLEPDPESFEVLSGQEIQEIWAGKRLTSSEE